MRAKFRTSRITDFLQYAKEEHCDSTAIFVLPDAGGATAIFDFGDSDRPMWGDHRAILSSVKTPAFAALEKMTQSALSQRVITDWIEDWNDIITAIGADGEDMPLSQAVAIIRRVDIKATHTATTTDEDMSASRETL